MSKKFLKEDPYAEDLVAILGLAGIPTVNKEITEEQMDEEQVEEAAAPKYWELDKKQTQIDKTIKMLRAQMRMYDKMVEKESEYHSQGAGVDDELMNHRYYTTMLDGLRVTLDDEGFG